ncbi:MAG: ATP-binding cassette domain-containing protein [bacterium]
MLALAVRNLYKEFGKVKAVDDVSFEVEESEIFGLIGPNGAGKTTTLRMIATLLQPSSGNIEVFGLNVLKEGAKIRGMISYLPEEAGAYKNLKGIDYLKFMAGFYARDLQEKQKIIARAIEIAKLSDRINDHVRNYSKGMVRKLLLARALATLLALFAQDVKDAQTTIMPLTIMILIPYFFALTFDPGTMSLGIKIFTFLIPFSHTFFAFKFLLLGQRLPVILGNIYLFLFAIGLLFMATKIFSSERILTMKFNLGKFRRKV